MKFKSIFAGVLAAATIFSIAGVSTAAPVAKAATEAEMQAQISALLAQIAALQASMSGGNSSSCYTFTTNLTLGSNSEAVRALQVFLNNKGYAIATSGVGSKGNETTYFGGLTRTALSKYQAAMAISPAAGYFGPVTRAKVNADCTPGTGGGNGTTTTGLNGGEATLNSFDLRREESTGAKGASKVMVGTARFDVDNGDARVERVKLVASSTNSSLEKNPWKYFDKVYVMDGNKTLTSMSVSSRSDWSEEGSGSNIYSLNINNVGYVVREGDKAEITFAFDISDSIDTANLAQSFSMYVPDQGIRATDGAGVQQYTGMTSDKITFGFQAAQNGDLSIRSSDSDPSAAILVAVSTSVSSAYDVFAFNLKNDQSADSLLTDAIITVSSTGATTDMLQKATLTVGGHSYDGDITTNKITFPDMNATLAGNTLTAFKLSTTLARNASGTVQFIATGASNFTAEGSTSGDSVNVTGSATSAQHTVALTGITVAPVSVSSIVTSPSSNASDTYGTFTIKFNVTAVKDDAYVATTSAANGTAGVNYSIVGSPSFAGTTSSLISVTNATLTSGYWKITSGSTAVFTLSVTLNPAPAGTYEVDLSSIKFASTAVPGTSTFTIDTRDGGYKTAPIFITN
jgi:hypothetical protein